MVHVTTEAKAKHFYMFGKQVTSRDVSFRLDVIMHERSNVLVHV